MTIKSIHDHTFWSPIEQIYDVAVRRISRTIYDAEPTANKQMSRNLHVALTVRMQRTFASTLSAPLDEHIRSLC